ncbi:unnamed protein product, partial [Laminaria digitata]
INERLEAVNWGVEGPMASNLRDALKSVPDVDRALSRLGLDRGGPRDLAAVRTALAQAGLIADRLTGEGLPDLITRSVAALTGQEDLLGLLDAALVAEPGLRVSDGGFVATGHDPALDEARTLRDEGRGVIARMQGEYAQETGVSSLKIKHNNVLGYFIETTALHAEKMFALSERFIHRQTTANQVRFTTVELSDMERRILNAGNEALEIERRIYEELRQAILSAAPVLSELALGLAEIDLSLGLAELARQRDWCRPKVDNSRAFGITGGRHPV